MSVKISFVFEGLHDLVCDRACTSAPGSSPFDDDGDDVLGEGSSVVIVGLFGGGEAYEP